VKGESIGVRDGSIDPWLTNSTPGVAPHVRLQLLVDVGRPLGVDQPGVALATAADGSTVWVPSPP
jgi:hypothetical protein